MRDAQVPRNKLCSGVAGVAQVQAAKGLLSVLPAFTEASSLIPGFWVLLQFQVCALSCAPSPGVLYVGDVYQGGMSMQIQILNISKNKVSPMQMLFYPASQDLVWATEIIISLQNQRFLACYTEGEWKEYVGKT